MCIRDRHLRPDGHDHGGHGQGEPHRHRRGLPGAAADHETAEDPAGVGAHHRDGHLDQPDHPVPPAQALVLHRLPHHQLHPAGRHRGLRHPVLRPLPGVPGHHGAKGAHRPHHRQHHCIHPDLRHRHDLCWVSSPPTDCSPSWATCWGGAPSAPSSASSSSCPVCST